MDASTPDQSEDKTQDRSQNIFNKLPSLAKPKASHEHNELDTYLASDIEDVVDALKWWHERCSTYPCLSRMAFNYLTIPGISSYLYQLCEA
ncbi:hypothetical protein SCLCIDRAFT_20092 [Scleroderma citrinum Foug A]|uniref:HAT C-terminal dimerisation domain-containing protein n=1 Tax=Scleroderma citrinum Foug A TaxID=1036808 RepID=A0A0C3AUX4_9AGAM|nr:hypothetical protein SCLCIDRAFT_20092 [Scleroderma citrinum Foug A]